MYRNNNKWRRFFSILSLVMILCMTLVGIVAYLVV